jgi:hypothetical protein
MNSNIAKALKLHFQPVTVNYSNKLTADAELPKFKGHSCIIDWVWKVVEGRTIAFERNHIPCGGAKGGLCIGDEFAANPLHLAQFLSTGVPGEGDGEHYKKTPELALASWQKMTKIAIKKRYIIFRPLADLTPDDAKPSVVIFPVNPDQLSALVVLANYARPSNDNVIVPFGSGCSTIVRYPYLEGRKRTPRAVIGFTDVTARNYHPADIMTFSVPWKMFVEMDSNVAGSFLDKSVWGGLKKRIK